MCPKRCFRNPDCRCCILQPAYQFDAGTVFHAVEDRRPLVYPWMNDLLLVSPIARVRLVPQEPLTVRTPGLPGGICIDVGLFVYPSYTRQSGGHYSG